ncbi:hypothetical protein [Hymenobacter sp. BRD67]|uniref:hypothetical protein n=1 Tax=Hymenobacter sp. BRD67 TaxID=2675877 RepID=UPI001566073E|nr:hypothetical protein [Hymenobacter sp. BRD67]QKG53527.1 hypothetical protein GKZ67_14135 [Hymenobacter sp. BRD67]
MTNAYARRVLSPAFRRVPADAAALVGLALLAPAIVLGVVIGVDSRHSALEMAGMTAFVTLLSFLLLGFAKLHTQLSTDGVRVRFVPLQSEWRFTPWAQVRRAYIRTYAPMSEYGGWGIRTFGGESGAYNAWGNQGLQLILTSGERLLIGTQQPAAIQQIMSQLRIRGAQPEVAD